MHTFYYKNLSTWVMIFLNKLNRKMNGWLLFFLLLGGGGLYYVQWIDVTTTWTRNILLVIEFPHYNESTKIHCDHQNSTTFESNNNKPR